MMKRTIEIIVVFSITWIVLAVACVLLWTRDYKPSAIVTGFSLGFVTWLIISAIGEARRIRNVEKWNEFMEKVRELEKDEQK